MAEATEPAVTGKPVNVDLVELAKATPSKHETKNLSYQQIAYLERLLNSAFAKENKAQTVVRTGQIINKLDWSKVEKWKDKEQVILLADDPSDEKLRRHSDHLKDGRKKRPYRLHPTEVEHVTRQLKKADVTKVTDTVVMTSVLQEFGITDGYSDKEDPDTPEPDTDE